MSDVSKPVVTDFTLETTTEEVRVCVAIEPVDGWVGRGDPIRISLAREYEFAADWWAQLPCRAEDDHWVGSLAGVREGEPRLAWLTEVATADGTRLALPEDTLRLERESDGEWESGDTARRGREDLQAERERLFSRPLRAPGADERASEHAVLMIVDNLLSTKHQRVPGIQVLPLQAHTLGSDLVSVINSVARQLGFAAGLEPQWAMNFIRERRPSVILLAPKVLANSQKDALDEARRSALALLDLLTLRRGAPPRLLGGIVGSLSEPSANVKFWVEGSGYTGNMLGGMFSGEDPTSLVQQWQGLATDPRSRLWLSLYSDALADERWDYRLFRCFNLLEGAATEILGTKSRPVTDTDGQLLRQDNGKPYTTQQARGKVFALLKHVAQQSQQSLQSFAAVQQDSTRTTWQETAIWLAVRNAVAHRGAWEATPTSAFSPREQEIAAAITRLGHDGTFASGSDATIRAIRRGVEATLISALRGHL